MAPIAFNEVNMIFYNKLGLMMYVISKTAHIIIRIWHPWVFHTPGIPVNPPAARGRLPRNGSISRRDYVSRAGGYNPPRSEFSPSKSPAVKIYAKYHVNGRYLYHNCIIFRYGN